MYTLGVRHTSLSVRCWCNAFATVERYAPQMLAVTIVRVADLMEGLPVFVLFDKVGPVTDDPRRFIRVRFREEELARWASQPTQGAVVNILPLLSERALRGMVVLTTEKLASGKDYASLAVKLRQGVAPVPTQLAYRETEAQRRESPFQRIGERAMCPLCMKEVGDCTHCLARCPPDRQDCVETEGV